MGKVRTAKAISHPVRWTYYILLAVAVFNPLAQAADVFWLDSSSDFNAAGSWNPTGSPTSSDRAIFYQNSPSFAPEVTSSISIGGVQLFSGGASVSFSASSGATLTIGSLGLVNDSVNTLTFNNSNLSLTLAGNSTFTGNGSVIIGSFTSSLNIGSNTLTLNGTGTGSSIDKAISNTAGSVVKSGAGTWTLSAANLHTGGTSINAGTLVVSAADALGTSGTISFGGGTLQFSGAASTTDYSSRFSTAASQQFKINTNGESLTLASALNSSGATLVKSGTGTLTLSANSNSATGGTTISGGSLLLTGATNNLGAVAVNSGGTLQIGATNTLVNTTALTLNGGTLQIAGGAFSQDFGTTPLSMTASSTIDFGSALGASAIVFGDSSAQTWTGTLTIANYSSGSDTLRFGTDANALTSGQLAAISFGGTAAQIDSSGFVTPVPEPATYAAGMGAIALAFGVYRRRRATLSRV